MQHVLVPRLSIALAAVLVTLCACSKQPPPANADSTATSAPDTAAAAPAAPESGGNTVTLKPDEVAKLGVLTTAATSVRYLPEKSGFAVVMNHDVVAQAAADVATAQAGVRESQAVLNRIQRLAGTAGAESAAARESAVHQAAIDSAALRLAEAKSSSILGQHPPWGSDENSKLITELATGRTKLLRITFPLGVLSGAAPRSLRAARLDAGNVDAANIGERWSLHAVWDAPADATVPGRSFFALLPGTDVREGERLLAWAAGDKSGVAEAGVLVPAAAVILSDGKYWCYLERQPGVFVRTPLAVGQPMAGGYFVKDSIKPGDPIVTAAAGLLLARETNSSTEAE